MRRFARLYERLDRTTRTSEKQAALVDYLASADPADAAWAVHFLAGRRLPRSVSSTELRTWASEATGHPKWLVEASYDVVGDLAETLHLLLPDPSDGFEGSLRTVVEERIAPLAALDAGQRRRLVESTWCELDGSLRFLWLKLLLGGFRVGVARRTVVLALAELAAVEPSTVEQRFSGDWKPTAEHVRRLLRPADEDDIASLGPRPFCLASPLDDDPITLGSPADWLIEWKWDGIRAQLVRRRGEVRLWSRGDEPVGGAFPEITLAARRLPTDAVLDGEILAWNGDGPRPFHALQRRIGRTSVEPSFWPDVEVVFMAYDLLELEGKDHRDRSSAERRSNLERIVPAGSGEGSAGEAGGSETGTGAVIRSSPLLTPATWEEARSLRESSRDRGVEGLMLKRADAPYGAGRTRGLWWKWKVEPFSIDAVLVHARRGHGRRAGLHTDYTFAVWDDEELVPVTSAYSGLTDEQFKAVDAHLRTSTVERKGPIAFVRPELVFEIGFEGLQRSTRHRSGIALRFPRMLRWRRDKSPAEADRLTTLRRLLETDRRVAAPTAVEAGSSGRDRGKGRDR